MKKYISILLILLLCLFSVGCEDSSSDDYSSDTSSYEDEYYEEDEDYEEDEFSSYDIPLHNVDSSAFSQIGYDDTTETLVVVFHNSGAYEYLNVPTDVAYDFENADSLGGFYNDYIKGQYPCNKL